MNKPKQKVILESPKAHILQDMAYNRGSQDMEKYYQSVINKMLDQKEIASIILDKQGEWEFEMSKKQKIELINRNIFRRDFIAGAIIKSLKKNVK